MCRWLCHLFMGETIPRRYYIVTTLAFSLVCMYNLRHCLVTVIAEAGRRRSLNLSQLTEQDLCPAAYRLYNKTRVLHKDRIIYWSHTEQHLVKSAFYLGYMTMHIPFGAYCDKHGGRSMLLVGLFCSGVLALIASEAIIRLPWYVMFIVSMTNGIFQAMVMTSSYAILARWTPHYQVATLVSLYFLGSAFGHVLRIYFSNYFLHVKMNWSAIFYFWGAVTLVITMATSIFVYSTVRAHPYPLFEEKMMLEEEIGSVFPKVIPWKQILKDEAVWGMIAGQFGSNWIYFLLASNMAKFFSTVIGVDIRTNTWYSILPYWLMSGSTMICAYIADHEIKRGIIPLSYLRLSYTALGNICPSICVLTATYLGCNSIAVATMFALALTFKGAYFAGLKTNILDLTRNYGATVMAIENGLGSVTGIFTAQMMEYMCSKNSVSQWRKVFWNSLTICIFTTTLYFIWARGERADWDYVADENHSPPLAIENTKFQLSV